MAIREFHSAGIVVKMITGDHPRTAVGACRWKGACVCVLCVHALSSPPRSSPPCSHWRRPRPDAA